MGNYHCSSRRTDGSSTAVVSTAYLPSSDIPPLLHHQMEVVVAVLDSTDSWQAALVLVVSGLLHHHTTLLPLVPVLVPAGQQWWAVRRVDWLALALCLVVVGSAVFLFPLLVDWKPPGMLAASIS